MNFVKKKERVIFLLLLMAQLGCAQIKDRAYNNMLHSLLEHDGPEISIEDAAQKMNYIFLDAREPREYEVSHIRDARLIGYKKVSPVLLSGLHTADSIIVYCSVGYRSEKMAARLRGMGFVNVFNLYGGIFEWVNSGLPVYNKEGVTDYVHPYNRYWGVWLKNGRKKN